MKKVLFFPFIFFLASDVLAENKPDFDACMEVKASAYTSHPDQTDETPFLAAWNNRLDPYGGKKVLAISPDLLKYGIGNGSTLYLKGYGKFRVVDKMNKKWRRKVDIYHGLDLEGAKKFGIKKIKICWKMNFPTW